MKEDGGPAFPCHDICHDDFPGMTLRDYFAAAAMNGIMQRDHFDPGQASPTQRAALAYIEADAMIAARNK